MRTAIAVPAPVEIIDRLVGDAVASQVGSGDWAGAVRAARPLVGEIEGLRERLRVAGISRVLLVTTDGVGVVAEQLAPGEPRLIVLDDTDPVQVADALAGDLDATVLVVSDPSGSAAGGVDLLWDTVEHAMRAEGLDPAAQTVVVAPPGAPMIDRASGATTVLGPPDGRGPWSAFTAYALVPAGLAGADVAALLADAAAARPALVADDRDNPALVLGALLAEARTVALSGAHAEGAAEQLGAAVGAAGPLPVVVEQAGAPGWDGADLTVTSDEAEPADVTLAGPTAARLLLWQHATAVAAHLLGVGVGQESHFPAPTGQESGFPALAGTGIEGEIGAGFEDGGIVVRAAGGWLPPEVDTVAGAVKALVSAAAERPAGHLAVHAYLDRTDDASAAVLRGELARRTGLVTTFGWAPRCLPGSGQHVQGVLCQLTGGVDEDAGPTPDPLAELQLGAAAADAAQRDVPVLRLHLTDRLIGLVTLARAVQEI
ncbi:glucose-6-phosphate isomerase [Pseudonocardia sp. TRM90224]|uniref:glucose-6-phosphate isomerase n=1 Tax=Pseudonocardia sp. TRM90224 TaxID=2812678 RepID=UPI001E29EF78|nr:glucose-6-phosphate isomerase [Pseudonocardia sp. TRM90224]